MSVWLGNPLVLFTNFNVPLLVAYVCVLIWGPGKGTLYGVVPMIILVFILVFILFVLQVSPGVNPDGSGRLASAYSYVMSEGFYWLACFVVGLVLGSAHHKLRGGQA